MTYIQEQAAELYLVDSRRASIQRNCQETHTCPVCAHVSTQTHIYKTHIMWYAGSGEDAISALARRLQQLEEQLQGYLSPSRQSYLFDGLSAAAAGLLGCLLPDMKVCWGMQGSSGPLLMPVQCTGAVSQPKQSACASG